MEKDAIAVEWMDETDGQEQDAGMTDMAGFEQIREGGRTYLTRVLEKDCVDEEAMLSDNRPKGYLFFMKKSVNGSESLFYDITGKQSLLSCCRKKPVGQEELAGLLLSVKSCLDYAEEYLLSEDSLVLCPAYVYTNLTRKQFYFVYFPSPGGTFGEHIRELAYFLMEHIDYKEDFAAALAGQLVQYAEAENFSMSVFLEESRVYLEHMGMVEKQEERAEDFFAESGSEQEETAYVQASERELPKRVRMVRQAGAAVGAALLLGAFFLPQSAKYLIPLCAIAGAAAGILPCYAEWAGRRLTQKEREVFMLSADQASLVSTDGCGEVQSGSLRE